MMINGGTGPVLAFAEILYKLSETLDVPFLTFNAWIGLWVALYMLIAAFVDLNRVLHYVTRFTDEIFSLLISTIFIINALGNPFAPVGVRYYFDPDHPSHDGHEDDPGYSHTASALMSLILCLGTVQVAFLLRKTKFSPFLPNQTARNIVTDFSVVFSIALWTLVAYLAGIPLETLNVPNKFGTTYACCDETCTTNWPGECPGLAEPYRRRPWLVDLGDLNGKAWVPLMAAGPALLAFVLVFLDDGLTWHLINHPSHKIRHGSAFHYDTVVIGIMVAVNSMLGLPWLVAATVRSLNHLHAMAEKTPDGKIQSVKVSVTCAVEAALRRPSRFSSPCSERALTHLMTLSSASKRFALFAGNEARQPLHPRPLPRRDLRARCPQAPPGAGSLWRKSPLLSSSVFAVCIPRFAQPFPASFRSVSGLPFHGSGLAQYEPVLEPRPHVLHAAAALPDRALHGQHEAAEDAAVHRDPARAVRATVRRQGD